MKEGFLLAVMSQRRPEEWEEVSQISREERTFPGRVNHICKLDSEFRGFEEPERNSICQEYVPVGEWMGTLEK